MGFLAQGLYTRNAAHQGMVPQAGPGPGAAHWSLRQGQGGEGERTVLGWGSPGGSALPGCSPQPVPWEENQLLLRRLNLTASV